MLSKALQDVYLLTVDGKRKNLVTYDLGCSSFAPRAHCVRLIVALVAALGDFLQA